jgi:hypothetical protein
MSTGARPEEKPGTAGEPTSGGAAEPGASVPVASDRPVVHGAATSAEELRTEVEVQRDPLRQEADALRTDVAATLRELTVRLDLRARARSRAQGAVAAAQRQVAERSAATARVLRERPGALGAAGVVLLLVLLALRRRSST